MIKIAVQDGLEDIKQVLQARGFEIVSGAVDDSVSAIIYSGVSCDWEGVPTVTNDWAGHETTPLLINAVGMTLAETADLLSSRLRIDGEG